MVESVYELVKMTRVVDRVDQKDGEVWFVKKKVNL